MTYYYPLVTTGYRWNLLKRCLWEIGIEPVCIADSGEQTFLEFSRELEAEEKFILDGIMLDNPQHPPSGGDAVTIVDVWEEFEQFKQVCGLPDLCLFYGEAVEGSGNINRVILWHPTALSDEEKQLVKTAYNNLLIG